MLWIGIHQDYHGKFWIESTEAEWGSDAFDDMERNDTNLMVFSKKEAERLINQIKKELEGGDKSGK